MRNNKNTLNRLLLVLPLIFLIIFYFYPLSKIVLLSFFPKGEFTFSKLSPLFESSTYLSILWFTLWQAALSTLLTLIVALPGCYIFSRYTFPGKHFLQALLTVPFVLPTVVVASAFRALLGDNGIVNTFLQSSFSLSKPPISLEQSLTFFLLAHIFYNYSLFIRIVGGFWASISPDIHNAARMLGASPFQTFRKITLPLLLPAIGSASLLVFIFCFTSFGVVLILGGPGYATLEVEIYRQSIQLFNLPMAAALSLLQILTNFILMWLHARLSQKAKVSLLGEGYESITSKPKTIPEKIWVASNLFFFTILLIAPLLALIFRSVLGENGFTLAYYSALFSKQAKSVFFVEPISAVTNSLVFASGAMCIALFLGILASTFLSSDDNQNTSFWDSLLMLPLATSAVTLGFGYIITLNKPPLNLRDSLILVPIAHALVALPFVIRCILPTLRHIPVTFKEAATVLGASPLTVWKKITLPLIIKPIMVAGVFAFSISLGEFGASSFVTRPHTPTMPVAIFRFLGQPGDLNYGQAMAMSSILMLVTCSGFWLISRIHSISTFIDQRR